MSIDFTKVNGWEIPEGKVVQVSDAIGRIIWLAMRKVKVTISSVWDGFDGDSASITITSKMPFAPNPSNPSNKVTTWTYFVYDQPNYTIEVPEGSTIQCTVSRDKGNADSYIKLNGLKEVIGDGMYVYTVTRDVTISIEERYSQGDYGVITIVEDGAVIAVPVILQVEKITSNTYAAETTYENEQFILLDIYPKTSNSKVNVTYGGLTKTITFSGTNAKQVYFGTFNGVADSMTTLANGELIIEGGCDAFACGSFTKGVNDKGEESTSYCSCITAVKDFGSVTRIPNYAFYYCSKLCVTEIPEGVTRIGDSAFEMESTKATGDDRYYAVSAMQNITLPKTIESIGLSAFYAPNYATVVRNVTILATTPPNLGAEDIQDVFSGEAFYVVPHGCKEAYATAWGVSETYIEEAG